MPKFRYPNIGEHHAILGCTGSGKTTLLAQFMSRAPFHVMPWFIVDYKRDEILNSSDRFIELELHAALPRYPGIYILHPRPDQEDEIESFFERLWHFEEAGLVIDEGTLAPSRAWLKNLLAQGRSKRISITVGSQRPVDVPRSVFTEAGILSVFRLNDEKDYERVRQFSPRDMLENRLPDYHSFWYSSKDHRSGEAKPYLTLGPVPKAADIIDTIDFRLTPKTRIT